MKKVYLFNSSVPYKWVKEAFEKAICEYLSVVKSSEVGRIEAWKKYLSYFTEHKGPYITDRVSNVYVKEVPTYLEFIAIPGRTYLHLYDGIDRLQKDVRIYDEYPIKGILISPEKDVNEDELVRGLLGFIKQNIDIRVNHVSGL